MHSQEGDLPFQHYFVRRQCEPAVSGFSFQGLADARPNPAVVELLRKGSVSHIVICPSNPFVSIDPILALPGLWEALRDHPAPVVVVSPIVDGLAIKGPAAKMMSELSLPATALGVAEHYALHYPGLVDRFLIDHGDATLLSQINALGMTAHATDTVMKTLEDKIQLARTCLSQVAA